MYHSGRGTGAVLHGNKAGLSASQRGEMLSHVGRTGQNAAVTPRDGSNTGGNLFLIRIGSRLCGLSSEAWGSCPLSTPKKGMCVEEEFFYLSPFLSLWIL